jgi:hypothetical protein
MDILDHKWEFYKANLSKNILYGYCENFETIVELHNHLKILMCIQISIQKRFENWQKNWPKNFYSGESPTDIDSSFRHTLSWFESLNSVRANPPLNFALVVEFGPFPHPCRMVDTDHTVVHPHGAAPGHTTIMAPHPMTTLTIDTTTTIDRVTVVALPASVLAAPHWSVSSLRPSSSFFFYPCPQLHTPTLGVGVTLRWSLWRRDFCSLSLAPLLNHPASSEKLHLSRTILRSVLFPLPAPSSLPSVLRSSTQRRRWSPRASTSGNFI